MRHGHLLALLLALALIPPAPLSAQQVTAIKADRIYTASGAVVENGVILLEAGKITRVGIRHPDPAWRPRHRGADRHPRARGHAHPSRRVQPAPRVGERGRQRDDGSGDAAGPGDRLVQLRRPRAAGGPCRRRHDHRVAPGQRQRHRRHERRRQVEGVVPGADGRQGDLRPEDGPRGEPGGRLRQEGPDAGHDDGRLSPREEGVRRGRRVHAELGDLREAEGRGEEGPEPAEA